MHDEPAERLIDGAYEAAIRPELWQAVLDDLVRFTDAAYGSLAAVSDGQVRSIASPLAEQLIADFFARYGRLGANRRITDRHRQ